MSVIPVKPGESSYANYKLNVLKNVLPYTRRNVESFKTVLLQKDIILRQG